MMLSIALPQTVHLVGQKERILLLVPGSSSAGILHFDAVEGSIDDFDALKKLWEECLETKLDPDVKGRIIGVQTQMLHYNTLFGLLLSKTILKISDNLSRTLQKQQCQQLRDGR